jgi:hypothetical protein
VSEWFYIRVSDDATVCDECLSHEQKVDRAAFHPVLNMTSRSKTCAVCSGPIQNGCYTSAGLPPDIRRGEPLRRKGERSAL